MKYWYMFYIGECPVCGKDKSSKQRILGAKPINPKDRIIYLTEAESYCGCLTTGKH